MRSMRDAALLLALILVAVTVRVSPAVESVSWLPETRASSGPVAGDARSLPALERSQAPTRTETDDELRRECSASDVATAEPRVLVRVETDRDTSAKSRSPRQSLRVCRIG